MTNSSTDGNWGCMIIFQAGVWDIGRHTRFLWRKNSFKICICFQYPNMPHLKFGNTQVTHVVFPQRKTVENISIWDFWGPNMGFLGPKYGISGALKFYCGPTKTSITHPHFYSLPILIVEIWDKYITPSTTKNSQEFCFVLICAK